MAGRYVALGSSFAAGPRITPPDPTAPPASERSLVNYPHLVARRLGLDLTDVSFGGATTAHLLDASQAPGTPAQVSALDGTEVLVTVTAGGNDVGYVAELARACLPPSLAGTIPVQDDDAHFSDLEERYGALLAEVRRRSPGAVVVVADYLTVLGPEDDACPPMDPAGAARARRVASRLEDVTARVAAAHGAVLVAASEASRDHHAWSADPWTAGWTLDEGAMEPAPGAPAPVHPLAAGMRAVADLVVEALDSRPG